jgi:hypothetical protein
MMKTRYLFSILLAGLATVAVAQEKQMYQWTDENGVVHFSDQRPAGQDVTVHDIEPDPAPQDGAAPAQTPGQSPEESSGEPQKSFAQQRREEIAAGRQKAREEAAANEAQCAAWRAEVDQLEPHRRVFFTNEDGETERVDDVERTERVAELKAEIARNCR